MSEEKKEGFEIPISMEQLVEGGPPLVPLGVKPFEDDFPWLKPVDPSDMMIRGSQQERLRCEAHGLISNQHTIIIALPGVLHRRYCTRCIVDVLDMFLKEPAKADV
jgi:hypothetical protein